MFLTRSQRVQQKQDRFRDILDSFRGDDSATISEQDVDFLATNFHLMSSHFSDQDRDTLTKDALFLFANKHPRDIFNKIKLQETHSPTNPVARIKAITKKKGTIVQNDSHYDESVPPATNLCRGARVSITGCNIMPSWGLYNGSIGTVLDIVYEEGQSPRTGTMPLYVLVDFPNYRGPPFDSKNPTVVPIVSVSVTCNHHCCCTREFIPLTLAFGKTVHTFQGQNAGPVDPGRPPNAVQRIICDPGTRAFEGICVGLFYTILSRATTLGHIDISDPVNIRFKDSAIYFFGSNMNKARIRNITNQLNGQLYVKVQRRALWVQYLKQHQVDFNMDPLHKNRLFDWAQTFKVSYDKLQEIILFHTSNT